MLIEGKGKIKQRVYYWLHEDKRVIEFIYALIIINVVALILESYQELRASYGELFRWIEVVSVGVFTVEYILRIWVADLKYSGKRPRLRFVASWMGIVDLIAILPFYLPMLLPIDLRVVRILRLMRLLRIFKLGRFSRSLRTIQEVLKETRSDLAITLFFALVLLILSSTLMYYCEGDAQPDKFASIGHSFWWSVATLTTVGYGDVYPVTAMGKLLSAAIALIGIGFVALPTGIISSAFVDKLKQEKMVFCECPHCGRQFEITKN